MRRDPVTGSPDLFGCARDYLHHYLPAVRALSPKTAGAYRISLESYLDYLAATEHTGREQLSFGHFDRPRLKAWLAWMTSTQQYAPATVALRLSAVKSFLAYAAQEDITLIALSQAAQALKAPGQPRKPITYLTPEQLRAVLAAYSGGTARSRRNRMLLIMLYESAARVSELTALRLGDLHLTEPGHVTLTGKRNKTRVVPLTGKTIAHLRVYLDEFHPGYARQPATRPLFYSRRDGQPAQLSADTVARRSHPGRRHRAEGLPVHPRQDPLPPPAQDQGHGPLPARHPAADHHAPARARERIDNIRFLCLRHPGHDAPGHRQSHPGSQCRRYRTAHRRPAPGPLQPPLARSIKPGNLPPGTA